MTTRYIVPLPKAAEFYKDIKKAFLAELPRALKRAGHEAVLLLEVGSFPINDRGLYRKGWKMHSTKSRLEVWNKVKHAIFVEDGRRPGAAMPPLAPIAAWLRRHGANPRLAYVVARSIARRGIAPRPTLKTMNPLLLQLVHDEIANTWDVACTKVGRI